MSRVTPGSFSQANFVGIIKDWRDGRGVTSDGCLH